MELFWMYELVPGTFIQPNCSGIFQGMSANRMELAVTGEHGDGGNAAYLDIPFLQ
jgi:hypothetical protein